MKRETPDSSSRSLFCGTIVLAAIGLLTTTSCLKTGTVNEPTPQPSPTRADAVLKYPENADEIADFFEVFSDRQFAVGDAIARLKITGSPRTSEKPNGSRVVYPEQNALIKEVQIDSSPEGLAEIHLIYAHPIKVDFDRLKDRIAPRYSGPPPGAVGFVSAQPSAAANMGPPPILVTGTPSNGRQTYSFAASGRTSIGRVTISAEDDGSGNSIGTKTVWEVSFGR